MTLIMLIFISLGIVLAVVVWVLYQRELPVEPVAPASQVQSIFSPDRKLQAILRSRLEGTFQVEVRERRVAETESGPAESWTLVYGPAIVASQAEAVEIANQQVGNAPETEP